jgi:putative aldouronate transport system substrate-binding protein
MKKATRREFLKYSGMVAAAGVMASCSPVTTPSVVPAVPTVANVPEPTATNAPSVPTITVATSASPAPTLVPATGDPWAIYPDTDMRHWVLDKVINPPKKYNNLEITQNYWIADTKYKEGESAADNVFTRWLKDVYGVYYKPIATVSGGDLTSYWATALASGDLPEFITVIGRPQYPQLHEADMLEDITDIWEKTASDLTKKKKHYGENKPYWKYVTDKGRIYGIPAFGGGAHNGEDTIWVRQDFLDQLGLKFPTTLDEMDAVGTAFVKAGLAKFGIWVDQSYAHTWNTLSFVFGAFGTMPTVWRRGADGKLAYGSLEPAQKDALTVLRHWYKDGMLNPDFLTTTISDIPKGVGGNLAGIVAAPWWIPQWPLPDSVKNDPKAKWAFGHLPAGPNGKRGRFGDYYVGGLSGFHKGVDPIKIEATINMLNWVYEMEDNQKSGYVNVFAFLGYDYTVQGDTAVLAAFSTLNMTGGALDFDTWAYDEKDLKCQTLVKQLMASKDQSKFTPLQKMSVDDPSGLWQLNAEAITIGFDDAQYNIYDEFIYPMTSESNDLMTSLNKLETQTYANIITGKAELSAWDQFAKDWIAQGGQKVTQQVNDEDAKHA